MPEISGQNYMFLCTLSKDIRGGKHTVQYIFSENIILFPSTFKFSQLLVTQNKEKTKVYILLKNINQCYQLNSYEAKRWSYVSKKAKSMSRAAPSNVAFTATSRSLGNLEVQLSVNSSTYHYFKRFKYHPDIHLILTNKSEVSQNEIIDQNSVDLCHILCLLAYLTPGVK